MKKFCDVGTDWVKAQSISTCVIVYVAMCVWIRVNWHLKLGTGYICSIWMNSMCVNSLFRVGSFAHFPLWNKHFIRFSFHSILPRSFSFSPSTHLTFVLHFANSLDKKRRSSNFRSTVCDELFFFLPQSFSHPGNEIQCSKRNYIFAIYFCSNSRF